MPVCSACRFFSTVPSSLSNGSANFCTASLSSVSVTSLKLMPTSASVAIVSLA